MHTERTPCEETQEDSHLQGKEGQRWPATRLKRGARQGANPSSQPSEGINPADPLISDCWTPDLRDNTFLLF